MAARLGGKEASQSRFAWYLFRGGGGKGGDTAAHRKGAPVWRPVPPKAKAAKATLSVMLRMTSLPEGERKSDDSEAQLQGAPVWRPVPPKVKAAKAKAAKATLSVMLRMTSLPEGERKSDDSEAQLQGAPVWRPVPPKVKAAKAKAAKATLSVMLRMTSLPEGDRRGLGRKPRAVGSPAADECDDLDTVALGEGFGGVVAFGDERLVDFDGRGYVGEVEDAEQVGDGGVLGEGLGLAVEDDLHEEV